VRVVRLDGYEEFTEEEFGRWLARKKLNEDLHSNLPDKFIETRNKI
jgi:hypothetical protein